MLAFFKRLLGSEETRSPSSPAGDLDLKQATADAGRCLQCGICSHNCPVGIEVREYARRGENITDSRCISCGTCIAMCPRGTLKWGPAILIRADNTLEVSSKALPSRLGLPPRRL